MGLIWGTGHSLSSFFLGALAFGILGQAQGMMSAITTFSELAVGLSFLFIGSLSLRETLQLGLGFQQQKVDDSAVKPNENNDNKQDFPNGTTKGLEKVGIEKWRMVLLNGMVHGLSLDGAPSLIPALAFGTWRRAFLFLMAYCAGTIGAMTGATFGVGESSQWLSKRSKRPELILRRLSAGSSLFAIIMGIIFSFHGLMAVV
jgi:hypothetical protein